MRAIVSFVGWIRDAASLWRYLHPGTTNTQITHLLQLGVFAKARVLVLIALAVLPALGLNDGDPPGCGLGWYTVMAGAIRGSDKGIGS